MSKRNILIITFWSYNDALVQTYTLPYVNMIRKILPKESKIFIVTFEQEKVALSPSELESLNVEFAKRNIRLIAFPYVRFGLKKLIKACGNILLMQRLVRKEEITTIHAFGPNAGGYGFLVSKLTGKELIIDSFEPHAEAMVENKTWPEDGAAYKILKRLEKWQAKRAKHLIGTTTAMKQYSKERYGYEPKSFFAKPSCVDTDMFFPRAKDVELVNSLGLQGKIVCVYAGKLGGIYLKEEVFDFFKACYEFWGDRFRCVMVTNAERKVIEEQLAAVNLPLHVVFSKFVPHQDVPRYLSLGDFALNPVKPVPTKRYCTSVKDGEYWAMGLPVVISPDISDDSDIILKEEIGGITDFVNKESMLRAIEKVDALVNKNNGLSNKIFVIAKKYRSYEIARRIYTEIYGE